MNEIQNTIPPGTSAPESVVGPVVKAASAWGAVAITSWADFAAMLAAFYTLILIAEWGWKKLLRPFAERRGWLKRAHRRHGDE